MAVYYVGHGRLSEVLRKFKAEYLDELAPEDLESDVILKLVSTRELREAADLSEADLKDRIIRIIEEL